MLITFIEAGIGHIVSAEAVANALEKYYPDEVEVEKLNILEEGGDNLKKHAELLVNQTKMGYKNKCYLWFLFFAQKLLTPMGTLKLSYNVAFGKIKKECADIMLKKDPDMIISTHFEPLHVSVWAKRKYKKDFLTAAYDPDPNVHAWWDNRCDFFAVNNEFAENEAVKKVRMKKENVFNSGFILRDSVKNFDGTKEMMREKYGIDGNSFTVIVADGAYASAKLKPFAEEMLKIDRKFTLIIVAGKNEEMKNYFDERIKDFKNISVKVLGFTKDIHELYAAADLFVTKAGPNAILDCAYMGTPVMTNYYTGPIELKTKELFIDNYGVGIHEANKERAVKLIESFIDDPALLAPYRKNCEKIKDLVSGEKKFADEIMKRLRENEKRKTENKR